MTNISDNTAITKLEVGIPGFDDIARGGIPEGRTTLVTGSTGTAKTVFGCQFLGSGIEDYGQNGVFVTFEENPNDIRINMLSFGWQIADWEASGNWAFVDVSQQAEETIVAGPFDLDALLARIRHAIETVGATRVVLDSISAVFARFNNNAIIRVELYRIASALKQIGVTTIMSAERDQEYGPVARYNIEEFVADNVIILRNILHGERRRRTLEILKFRGAIHHKGEYPFTIIPDEGIEVIPLASLQLRQDSNNLRVTSGSQELDDMCNGGFFRDSVVMVSGATGAGKTLLATTFMAGGAAVGERSLMFAFEESPQQIFRNAAGWGIDIESLASGELVQIHSEYPETAGLEDHLIRMKSVIEEYQPKRIVVDSISALRRISSATGFREFIIALTSFIKHEEIAGLFTTTATNLTGSDIITEAHISTITDSIILLRYIEFQGTIMRGITILKMRGSLHDQRIREFTIDSEGIHVGRPLDNIGGILAGNPRLNNDDL
ncbi:MAG: circadian clock protein KaiC [Chloroflexota bacterium]